MPIEILMPALSPTMTEGNLAKWAKSEGDRVEPGDVIAEIETDKATMEVEAVEEGTLGRIVVPAGTENVSVNQVIALLLTEGEDASALDQGGHGGHEPAAGETSTGAVSEATAATPAPAPAGNGAASVANGGERIAASPLARRMAEQAGLDLSAIAGSGPRGRIVKVDIERALKGGARAEQPRPAVAEPGTAVPPAAEPARSEPRRPLVAPAAPPQATEAEKSEPVEAPRATYEEIPLSSMRRTIARRLSEAKRDIPHFYLSIACRLDALIDLRRQLNERPGATHRLSLNDFVIKAAARAVCAKPEINAQWGGDRLYRLRDVDIAVAVAIPGGLVTPIIRRADEKGIAAISSEMKGLAGRAREGRLKPHEYEGGGLTISNLGMYDIERFEAVINPPQAAILAVGAGIEQPVVKDGAIEIATMMSCTLSVDHRIVDGVLAAEWLQAFRSLIEDPLALLL